MLKTVKLDNKQLADYSQAADSKLLAEVSRLGKKLQGKRILQINATSVGGGVAEILRSEVPLINNLGISCTWQTLDAPLDFFDVTKRIHNGLQGDRQALADEQWRLYEDFNQRLANVIDVDAWDLVVIHDPQPVAVVRFIPSDRRSKAKWVWRCHLDSKHANPGFKDRFEGYLQPYDGAIYTLEKYALPGLYPARRAFIPMAIDPLTAKNQTMSRDEAGSVVEGFGIDTTRPLMVQVSRFDPWKDPVGVMAAWKLARREISGLQLALVGDSAKDDPEGRVVLEQVLELAKGEQNGLYVVHDQAGDRAVKAFQTYANVVVQKSLREGFGLTVTEALWAGTPVIGSDVGGIPVQIEDGVNGFLVGSVEECAERVVQLVEEPDMARRMGRAGRETVQQEFLLPRLVRDNLKFWGDVLGG